MSNPTRRAFLQTGSAALATAALASHLPRSLRAASSERFRVGIIGHTGRGNYGHSVDTAFTKMSNVEIAALADPDESGRAAAQQRTGAKRAYASYGEMLANEKLDAVAICTGWMDQHREMIVAAAEAGCHVYMEKPFCPTLADCDEVVAALEKRNLKLGIAHITQYSPVLSVVQSLIQNGEIGDVLELRARGKEDRRGGGEDLWTLGSHAMAMMRSLAGGSPVACEAVALNEGHKVAKSDVVEGAAGIGLLAGDNIQARYTFGDGVYGHFASRRNMAGSPTRFAVQVFGSKGIIEMESGYLKPAFVLRDSSWSPGRSGKSWETITSAGIGKPEPRQDGTYEGGHIAAISDLFESVVNDRATKCSADDCRWIVEMIAAVYESHRVGGPIDMPLQTRVNPLSLLS